MRTSSVDIVIMEVLKGETTHLTAQAVYERIRERLPAVNTSTVYRALERLTESGQISISDIGGGAAVFEAVGSGIHHHLICQECHRILTLSHDDVKEFFSAIGVNNHFQITTNHLILFGVCENCLIKNGAKPLPPIPEE